MIYDITSYKSFETLKSWFPDINEITDNKIHKILIGNKCDLEDKREVPKEDGVSFALENKMLFFETSVDKGININEFFFYANN